MYIHSWRKSTKLVLLVIINHSFLKLIIKNSSFFVFVTFLSCWTACSSVVPIGNYASQEQPTAPDYQNPDHWAALPTKMDEADKTPDGIKNRQDSAAVDVFFLYPTIYSGTKKYQTGWNAPIDNEEFNKSVDESTIRFQASVFNGAGKIYAPRYRQAHINAYYNQDKASAKAAFDLAYSDLKKAFQYYLDNYNNGRPIIIAAHSQGTTHGKKLVKEFFDGTPLQKQLVAAYLVGIQVENDQFENINACQYSSETGCFLTWRTWKRGVFPDDHNTENNIVVTNPLTWTTENSYAPLTLNKGGVLRQLDKTYKGLADAEIIDGVLWTNKPQFFGDFLFTRDNYHIADYNFYYLNVRENAIERAATFLKKQ